MLTTLRPRRVPNSTAPACRANRVSSPPRPTPVPGWKWVPRWRTMISPAPTTWPPNRFTPRRWELESRPLLVLAAPFLGAIVQSFGTKSWWSTSSRRSEGDVGDLDLGVLLAVTLALLVAGLVLVLLDDDLRALGAAGDLDGHARLVEAGRGDLVAVDDHHHRKGEGVTGGSHRVDLDDVAHGNLLLLAATAHDCVHGESLSSIRTTGLRTGALRTTPPGTSGEYAAWRARRDGVSNTEGQDYGIGCRPGKTRSATPFSEPYRLREPFFLIGTCSTTGASSGAPEAVSAPSTGVGATASPDGVPVPGSRPAVPGSTTPVCGTVPAPDGGPAGRLADRRRVRVTTLGFSGSAGGASAGSSSAGSLDGSLVAG